MSEKLTFTAVDQHRFEANIYPAENTAAPLLVFFSALGTPAKVYRHFGSEMSRNGVHVCAPDWRGIDSSSVRAGRACDFGYRHLVEMDMACVIDVVRHRFPESPLWLGGHSLGGQLSLLCAAANDDQVAGVVTVASGTVHLPCYSPKMRVGIGGLVVMSRIAGPLLGYFPGSRVGFGGREAAGIMRDWSHVALTGEYRPNGSQLDYERLMSELKRPVLALTFAADEWSPAPAAAGLLSKLPERSVVHWHLSAAETGGVALDHYSWLKQPSLVAPAVAKFIDQSPEGHRRLLR